MVAAGQLGTGPGGGRGRRCSASTAMVNRAQRPPGAPPFKPGRGPVHRGGRALPRPGPGGFGPTPSRPREHVKGLDRPRHARRPGGCCPRTRPRSARTASPAWEVLATNRRWSSRLRVPGLAAARRGTPTGMFRGPSRWTGIDVGDRPVAAGAPRRARGAAGPAAARSPPYARHLEIKGRAPCLAERFHRQSCPGPCRGIRRVPPSPRPPPDHAPYSKRGHGRRTCRRG